MSLERKYVIVNSFKNTINGCELYYLDNNLFSRFNSGHNSG
jgi:hypothetical protein